jgi:hypothetical protein
MEIITKVLNGAKKMKETESIGTFLYIKSLMIFNLPLSATIHFNERMKIIKIEELF